MPHATGLKVGFAASLGTDDFASQIRVLGPLAHFDPYYGCVDDGSTLSSWTDRVGGYVLASTSGATRLTYSTSLSGLANRPGWMGVVANSTKLVSTTAALADALEGTQSWTLYSVRKLSGVSASTSTIASWGSTSTSNYLNLQTDNGASAPLRPTRRQSGNTNTFTSTVNTGVNLGIATHIYNGATLACWDNGTSGGSVASTTSLTVDLFAIGALYQSGVYSGFYGGYIGDLIIFQTAHDTTTRTYVEGLLSRRYS